MVAGPHEEFNRSELAGRIMRSFLAGDPLDSIARSAAMTSYEALCLIGSRLADYGELERSRAIRNRCASATKVLASEWHLVSKLSGSGIRTANIPTILAALGHPIDVDIAVKILNKPFDSLAGHSPSNDGNGDPREGESALRCRTEPQADARLRIGLSGY